MFKIYSLILSKQFVFLSPLTQRKNPFSVKFEKKKKTEINEPNNTVFPETVELKIIFQSNDLMQCRHSTW